MVHKFWSVDREAGFYRGIGDVSKSLEPGLYEISEDFEGNPCLKFQKLREDRQLTFHAGPMSAIVREVDGFWSSGDHYRNLGVTHRRGILLHGPAGCGKTGIMSVLIADVIARNGIAVRLGNPGYFNDIMSAVRNIEPARPILVVQEDLDDYCCRGYESSVLEILDGATSIGGGILFVFTTNHLDRIPPRIRCRPSRIDTLVDVPAPSVEQRLEYLKFICTGPFQQPHDVLDLWAASTDRFSLAALKELVVSMAVYRQEFRSTLDRLTQLLEAGEA